MDVKKDSNLSKEDWAVGLVLLGVGLISLYGCVALMMKEEAEPEGVSETPPEPDTINTTHHQTAPIQQKTEQPSVRINSEMEVCSEEEDTSDSVQEINDDDLPNETGINSYSQPSQFSLSGYGGGSEQKNDRCPDCDGGGDILGLSGNGVCSTCHGTGESLLSRSAILLSETVYCHVCNGSKKCQTCGGSGTIG